MSTITCAHSFSAFWSTPHWEVFLHFSMVNRMSKVKSIPKCGTVGDHGIQSVMEADYSDMGIPH